MPDLNAESIEAAYKTVAGTARSMGLESRLVDAIDEDSDGAQHLRINNVGGCDEQPFAPQR